MAVVFMDVHGKTVAFDDDGTEMEPVAPAPRKTRRAVEPEVEVPAPKVAKVIDLLGWLVAVGFFVMLAASVVITIAYNASL